MIDARFKPGDKVYVRDLAIPKDGRYYDNDGKYKAPQGGFRIVEAFVADVHWHADRAPWYPHGEGYSFNGDERNNLTWDCYPGCRVYATREEALAARMTQAWVESRFYPHLRGRLSGAA